MVTQPLPLRTADTPGAAASSHPEGRAARHVRLAIVVNCYNYEAYVGRAIASVLSQLTDDCDLVVVDDGSTDGSWRIIGESPVRAYRKKNGGQISACLYGLDRTLSDFVLFLDADDELRPGALPEMLRRLDSGVSKLQYPLVPIDGDGDVIGAPSPRLRESRDGEAIVADILRSGVYTTPPTSGNVFRRDVCDLLRDVDYDTAVDGVILTAAPFMGDVVSLASPLGNYRVHGRNDSGMAQDVSAGLFLRDMRRFVLRNHHLQVVLDLMGSGKQIPRPQRSYYYNEKLFFYSIVHHRRVPVWLLARSLRSLVGQTSSLRYRVIVTGFLLALFALPHGLARFLLARRLASPYRRRGRAMPAAGS